GECVAGGWVMGLAGWRPGYQAGKLPVLCRFCSWPAVCRGDSFCSDAANVRRHGRADSGLCPGASPGRELAVSCSAARGPGKGESVHGLGGGMRGRGLILLTLCLAALIINLDTTIVNVALPALVRQTGATTTNPHRVA